MRKPAVRFVVTARHATLHESDARGLPTLIRRLQREGFTVSVRVAEPKPGKPMR